MSSDFLILKQKFSSRQPKETHRHRVRDNYYSSESSFSDRYLAEDDYIDPLDEESLSEHQKEENQRTIDGFKGAVKKGNESLVKYYLIHEHESLHLMETKWRNGTHLLLLLYLQTNQKKQFTVKHVYVGDGCLHVAVRHKHFNLIKYLLSQGVSVNIHIRATYNLFSSYCQIVTL